MRDTIIVFLALLVMMCQVGLLALAISWIGWRNSAFFRITNSVKPYAASLALLIGVVTVVGSLYFSEVKHFIPCQLCWIQRGLLYPQALIAAALIWKPASIWIRRVGYGLILVCVPVSIYHYLLEWYPNLETSVCDVSVPCTLVWVREFGYISIPLMALTSALTILSLLYISRPPTTDSLKGA